jgi:predicted MFS family arabinose efflux permease
MDGRVDAAPAHALYMGIFGEFENVGVTIGPILGGVAWSVAGIQAAFYTYAVSALPAALVAALMVEGRTVKTVSNVESEREVAAHDP